jgi:hypothetical protein
MGVGGAGGETGGWILFFRKFSSLPNHVAKRPPKADITAEGGLSSHFALF